MAENEFEKKYNEERQARLDAEAKSKADEAAAKKYQAELAVIKKATEDKAKADAESDLRKFCEDQVKGLKMTPAGRDAITNALDDGKHIYTHAAGFSIPVDVFKKYVDTYKDVIDPVEKGNNDKDGKKFDSVQTEVDARVTEYCEKHEKVSYADAMTKVLAEDSDLADRYRDDTNRG